MNVIVYQTLDDRDNPDEVEKHGPYECRGGTSWLGYGYYFWDTHIQLGYWWGDTVYDGEYVICKAVIELNENNCFDIHGNGEYRMEFEHTFDELKKVEKDVNEITVARVISFLRKMQKWSYSAIRVLGMNSFKRYETKRGLYWDEVNLLLVENLFLIYIPQFKFALRINEIVT